MKLRITLCVMLAASALPLAEAAQPSSLYQGLISFRDGPDPAGRTPVYWATSQSLYGITSPRAAEAKFGANWVRDIRWCGDSAGRPLTGECSDIYYNFRHSATVVTEHTQNLLHP